MAARAAALMEMADLVEAFLLRLPPDDPASLVRAALVCKLWRRVLADRGFRRRFRELHLRPAMLGLLVFLNVERGSRFTPTSSFRPRNADLRGRYAVDSRHGRVLLARSLFSLQSSRSLAVWDPISGDWMELPELPAPRHLYDIGIRWNGAVLCASNSNPSSASASACGSTDCHLGHFRVVLMAISCDDRAYVFVYSSQAGTWSKPTSAAVGPLGPVRPLCAIGHGALVGNVLYFKVFSDLSDGILKYDIGTQEISSVNLPPHLPGGKCRTLLTTTEYGELGVASLESSKLQLWSGEAGPGGHLGWAPSRVIELDTVLPPNTNTYMIHVAAFRHVLSAFLVCTFDGIFSVDLESNSARKLCDDCVNAIPYMCFCTPGAAHVAPTDTGEAAGVSYQVHEELKFVVKE